MKIALDAMGGDRAPDDIVLGGIQAERDFEDVELFYVGHEERIKDSYRRFAPGRPLPRIHHAEHSVGMGDSPMKALREFRDNSISKGIELQKEGLTQAFVSAGNTGACVAAATLGLRMLEGVQRPGIACLFPSAQGDCLVLDCGANVNARPNHLLAYAILGREFRRLVHHKEEVTVGLLNIGEETAKGNDFIKETFELLSDHSEKINFIGNVEARDIFQGGADVVVCEGFVGNSLLKGAEGLSKLMMMSLKETFTQSLLTKLAALVVKPGLKNLRKKGDPNEFGGAPLLGVNGNVIISHGSSSPWGIRNAVRTAREMVKMDLNRRLTEQL